MTEENPLSPANLRFLFAGSVPSEVVFYTVGVSIISEHMKCVASFLLKETANALKGYYKFEQSLAFINGTGLNLCIQDYGLDIGAENLRDTFYGWIDHERMKKKSLLSSATTLAP